MEFQKRPNKRVCGMKEIRNFDAHPSWLQRVCTVFEPLHVKVENDSWRHQTRPGGHWRLLLVSQVFEGLNRVERQRLVWEAIDRDDRPWSISMRLLSANEFQTKEAQIPKPEPCRGAKKVGDAPKKDPGIFSPK